MKQSYKPPKILKKWTLDISNGELYELFIFDNHTICSAVGRYGHSSGATNFTWQQLLNDEFDSHIIEIFGNNTLQEVKIFIQLKSKFNLSNFLNF